MHRHRRLIREIQMTREYVHVDMAGYATMEDYDLALCRANGIQRTAGGHYYADGHIIYTPLRSRSADWECSCRIPRCRHKTRMRRINEAVCRMP